MARDTDFAPGSYETPSAGLPWHLQRETSGEGQAAASPRYEETFALVQQASVRSRTLQDRIHEIEEQARETVERIRQSLETSQDRLAELEQQLQAAETRADEAEARAGDAEAWMERIHQEIAAQLTPEPDAPEADGTEDEEFS